MLALAIIFLALGVFLGARYGGRYYLRRLTEFEHTERLRRSGLGKRS